ncbi:hypothetical protein LOAG_07754 [Loa loa]|uniref:Uncharacterized protein n=1 Tax=Loa loa TaxID=7209 RepID=A0A1S0TVD6_LOALO|nr:hypothetical protein LOAG_07754 [Loa loa]EFO20736.1 hypothetical protein LOAG_07754 [Loa loa]
MEKWISLFRISKFESSAAKNERKQRIAPSRPLINRYLHSNCESHISLETSPQHGVAVSMLNPKRSKIRDSVVGIERLYLSLIRLPR